jgi:hypothetical protein
MSDETELNTNAMNVDDLPPALSLFLRVDHNVVLISHISQAESQLVVLDELEQFDIEVERGFAWNVRFSSLVSVACKWKREKQLNKLKQAKPRSDGMCTSRRSPSHIPVMALSMPAITC